MTEHPIQDEHERFKELSALANAGALSPGEAAELTGHLQHCMACREIHDQYRLLAREGIPVLAAAFSEEKDFLRWDDTATRKKLLARIRAAEQERAPSYRSPAHIVGSRFYGFTLRSNPWTRAALAACLLVSIGFAGYRLGNGVQSQAQEGTSGAAKTRFEKSEAERRSMETRLRAEEGHLAQVQQDSLQKREGLAKLRTRLRELEVQIGALAEAKHETAGQLQAASEQRDRLSAQLREAERSYQAELAGLRSERDKALSRTGSLESRIDELTAINRDQDRRLRDDEQYLASDRDIRDLMGARKLYIADVFDVDSGSRTKRPSGRIFYTQGKSLIFYAFDLDRQSGVKNASTFQVWGQKETAQEEHARPMSLGMLYMDSESNRRWVMRFDDPKQLAEIDAVFVTVEPRGGSQKPSGKPFLYALLRKEVNHP